MELNGILPPASSSSSLGIEATSLTRQLQKMRIVGEDHTVLGQKVSDLIEREPSPSASIGSDRMDSTFDELLRSPWLVQKLEEHEITHPSPIQRLLLTKLKETRSDLLIKAQTGTGKSYGYLVALLDSFKKGDVAPQDHWEPKHLILVPNSILADQLVEWTKALVPAEPLNAIRAVVTEGDSIRDEQHMEPGFAHIVVATPKGLLLRLAQGKLKLGHLRTIVLDEADHLIRPLSKHATMKERMNRKKHPVPAITALFQIRDYFERIQKHRPRVVVLSATLCGRTRDLLKHVGLVQKDASLFLEDHLTLGECPSTIQHFHRVLSKEGDIEEMARIIAWIAESHEGQQGIVFMKAEQSKAQLASWLESMGLEPRMLSAEKNAALLIASDIDARGVDLPRLQYVIHADCPDSATNYLHVAGRVGRMGRSGSVYSLLQNCKELEMFTGYLSRFGINSSPYSP